MSIFNDFIKFDSKKFIQYLYGYVSGDYNVKIIKVRNGFRLDFCNGVTCEMDCFLNGDSFSLTFHFIWYLDNKYFFDGKKVIDNFDMEVIRNMIREYFSSVGIVNKYN